MIAAIVLAAGVSFAGTQPQLAGSSSQVYLAFGSGDVVSVARSTDGGVTFADPVALPAAGRLALGRHRGPRIAVSREAVLVATIAGAKGGGADGDVRLSRSLDGGRTWSPPVVINDVPGAAREGLHALAANDAGTVVVAWLDLREKGTRVYAATSRDHGATWSPDVLVYASPSGSICECCHPSVAIDVGGRIAVQFRNHVDGARDMYVVRSRDGRTFTPAVKQGTGSWPLEACPMDGGAVAIDGDAMHTVWRREQTIYASRTADVAGSVAETPLGDGRDPAAAASGGLLDVAWTDTAGVVQLRQHGRAPRALGPGGFASLIARPDRTIVAVEHQGRVSVRVEPR
ncbi:MAG: sialidase family protein [Vicinamibacteraceae bacterium]